LYDLATADFGLTSNVDRWVFATSFQLSLCRLELKGPERVVSPEPAHAGNYGDKSCTQNGLINPSCLPS